jgi:hypothetical protein
MTGPVLLKPRSRRIVVPHELDGKPAGVQIEHWDGRVDANIFARPVHQGDSRLMPVQKSERDRALYDSIKHDFKTKRALQWLMRLHDERGAIGSTSGMFLVNWVDMFDATQLAFNMLSDTMKYALFTDTTTTPNFSTNTAYGVAPFNANEIPNGSGYTTGGFTPLASKTVSESPSGTIMFDFGDPSWTSATFSGVRGGLIYDSTLTTNLAICLQAYGADFSVTAGTLTVQINVLGAFTLDITP